MENITPVKELEIYLIRHAQSNGNAGIKVHDEPTIQDMANGGNVFADWMEDNKSYVKSRHIMVFAWNEFEEGAWICPTYDDDLNIDSSRVKVFSEMVQSAGQP